MAFDPVGRAAAGLVSETALATEVEMLSITEDVFMTSPSGDTKIHAILQTSSSSGVITGAASTDELKLMRQTRMESWIRIAAM